eukprot:2991009-Pyramimonas_sp.AAC.1
MIIGPVFHDAYFVESMVIDAVDRGLPQRRKRMWTVMVHRLVVLEQTSTLSNVINLFKSPIIYSWQIFLVASDDEKLHELKWASRETNPKRASSAWPTGVAVTLEVDDAFVKALS